MLDDVFVCMLGHSQYTQKELEAAISGYAIVTSSSSTLISFQTLMQEVLETEDADYAPVIKLCCAVDIEAGLLMIETDSEDVALIIISRLFRNLGMPGNARVVFGPAKSASFLSWMKHNAESYAALDREMRNVVGSIKGAPGYMDTLMELGVTLGMYVKFQEGLTNELIESSDVPLEPEQAVSLLRMGTICSMVHSPTDYGDIFAMLSAGKPPSGLH